MSEILRQWVARLRGIERDATNRFESELREESRSLDRQLTDLMAPDRMAAETEKLAAATRTDEGALAKIKTRFDALSRSLEEADRQISLQQTDRCRAILQQCEERFRDLKRRRQARHHHALLEEVEATDPGITNLTLPELRKRLGELAPSIAQCREKIVDAFQKVDQEIVSMNQVQEEGETLRGDIAKLKEEIRQSRERLAVEYQVDKGVLDALEQMTPDKAAELAETWLKPALADAALERKWLVRDEMMAEVRHGR